MAGRVAYCRQYAHTPDRFFILAPVCPSIRSAGHSCGYSRVFPQGFPTVRNRDRMRGPACARTYGRWFIRSCGWRFLRVPECLNTLQSKRDFSISVSFWSLVAACGSKWQGVASFSARFQGLKRPTFAPKRQGKAESAHRRPRLRPSFGQQEGIGLPMPCRVGNNRSIPNTDFCVLKDTARCPLSNSKGFGLLPKRPCPSRGGLPLRSREACFHLRCVCFGCAHAVTPLNPM